jgi:hypothetical protein
MCICVGGMDFVSMIFLLNFGIVLTVWYIFFPFYYLFKQNRWTEEGTIPQNTCCCSRIFTKSVCILFFFIFLINYWLIHTKYYIHIYNSPRNENLYFLVRIKFLNLFYIYIVYLNKSKILLVRTKFYWSWTWVCLSWGIYIYDCII